LNGRQIPWVFFRFRFEAKDGIIDSKFSDGASDNPNGPDAKDFSRVPTIYVYRRYYDLSDSKWKVELIQKKLMRIADPSSRMEHPYREHRMCFHHDRNEYENFDIDPSSSELMHFERWPD
jgi:hypothetical protein